MEKQYTCSIVSELVVFHVHLLSKCTVLYIWRPLKQY